MTNNKQFYNYVIPSIGSMLVIGLYFVVDGMFVGRGVGINGLAAVNLATPFISILTSVTMMITMGGATIASIYLGMTEHKKANNTFNTSMQLTILFATAMSIISIFFSTKIAQMLGASQILVNDTAIYIKYYVSFGIFFCSSMTLSAFVRNDGNPNLAFWGMIIGALSNIFLDWLFIFPFQMGLIGAAIASGLGQLLSCLILLTHFIFKKGVLRFAIPIKEKGLITQIIKVGTPEFITQSGRSITVLCYNLVVLDMLGEIGLSAFSVISYLIIIIIALFLGVAQGIQPLLSRSFGQNEKAKETFFFRKGLKLNILLSLIIYIIMIFFGENIISLFNSDSEMIRIAYNCIIIYGGSFVFAAINIVYTTYFLATKRTMPAIAIAILRSVVFNTIFIFLMPTLLGKQGIWLGIIVVEVFVMIVSLVWYKKNLLIKTSKQMLNWSYQSKS